MAAYADGAVCVTLDLDVVNIDDHREARFGSFARTNSWVAAAGIQDHIQGIALVLAHRPRRWRPFAAADEVSGGISFSHVVHTSCCDCGGDGGCPM